MTSTFSFRTCWGVGSQQAGQGRIRSLPSVRAVVEASRRRAGPHLTTKCARDPETFQRRKRGNCFESVRNRALLTREWGIVATDIIAYVNHDIERCHPGRPAQRGRDSEISARASYKTPARASTDGRDVVEEHCRRTTESIAMSAEVLARVEALRTFMFQNVYLIPAFVPNSEGPAHPLTLRVRHGSSRKVPGHEVRRTPRPSGHRLHRRNDRSLCDESV